MGSRFIKAAGLFCFLLALVGVTLLSNPPSSKANGSGMQLQFTTSGSPETVRIGLGDYGDIYINWGDGSALQGPLNSGSDRVITHAYSTAGTYNVYISGTRLAHFGDCAIPGPDYSLAKVFSWGAFNLTDLSCAFSYRFGVDEVPSTIPDGVTNLHRVFEAAGSFDQDLNGWDTSQVVDMSSAFSMAGAFTNDGRPLTWNTANVEDMNKMFHYATAFNADVSGFNTSKVENMQFMFAAALSFNQSLASWNISNVQYMNGMFYADVDPDTLELLYSLSNTNYSNTLTGWASWVVLTGVTLDAPANTATTCAGRDSRDVLTSAPNSWNINDITPTGPCSPEDNGDTGELARTGQYSLGLAFAAMLLLLFGGALATRARPKRP